MGIGTYVFGLSHRKAQMRAQNTIAYKNMDVQRYNKAIEKNKDRIKYAMKSGNQALAEKLAAGVVNYRAKVSSLLNEISDLENINMHAMTQATDERVQKRDINGLIRYADKEANKLDILREPYAVKLREAGNNLSKAQEANSAAMEGVVGDTYVPQKASEVLEEILAEEETTKEKTEQLKAQVQQAAEAAAGGTGA